MKVSFEGATEKIVGEIRGFLAALGLLAPLTDGTPEAESGFVPEEGVLAGAEKVEGLPAAEKKKGPGRPPKKPVEALVLLTSGLPERKVCEIHAKIIDRKAWLPVMSAVGSCEDCKAAIAASAKKPAPAPAALLSNKVTKEELLLALRALLSWAGEGGHEGGGDLRGRSPR